ncbi:MAG: hypothetical protein IAF94_09350 [Pirellulaceae bacterium]|nr:hypothetical protein [Pirellulaceae bacterium]
MPYPAVAAASALRAASILSAIRCSQAAIARSRSASDSEAHFRNLTRLGITAFSTRGEGVEGNVRYTDCVIQPLPA